MKSKHWHGGAAGVAAPAAAAAAAIGTCSAQGFRVTRPSLLQGPPPAPGPSGPPQGNNETTSLGPQGPRAPRGSGQGGG